MRTTLVVPTYQRRDAVLRLLRAVLDDAPPSELDVVVVVDGSTDGTAAAVRELAVGASVAIRAVERPNGGLSAARNTGLDAVGHDGVVWFLDDDMVPAPGTVARHVAAHESTTGIVMAPCLFPQEHDVVGMNRDWAEHVHATLASSGVVERVELFHAANTSARVATWRSIGPFHEGFVGWGAEDYEYGLRALAAGVPVAYDVAAVAWHLQHRTIPEMCRTKEGEGANGVRLARLHPEQLDVLFPAATPGRDARALRRLRRSPRALRAVARAAARAAAVEDRVLAGRRRRCFDFAVLASRVAGIAEVDGDGPVLSRVLDGAVAPATAR